MHAEPKQDFPPEGGAAAGQAQPGSYIAGSFSMTIPLPNNAQMSIQGHIYLDDTEEEVAKRMDLFRKSMTRQQEIGEIPLLEAQIEASELQVEHMQKQLDTAKKKQQGAKRISSNDQQMLDNMPTSLKMIKDSMEKGRKKIATTREKYGLG